MSSFDAVTLGILWNRLIAISDEIVSTLIRTSFSINVRESYDLSCVLFDADGNPIAQGSYSVPSFTGTAGPTIAHMLKRFPADTLREGDVIATNDPWMGTGHLYDINIMRPVFYKGKRIGFTMSITHLPDIGGAGNSSTSAEVYEEGLRLPVCKLMNAGELNEELFDLIKFNVRVQDQVIGDIMANISCNEVGGRLLCEFMEEYGLEDLGELSRAVRDQSESVLRDRLSIIPDGEYRNSIQIEGIDDPITLSCHIVKKGPDVAIDFEGTGDSVRAGLNVPFCYTQAWAVYAIKCLVCPDTPNNEGQSRPVHVTAPKGCILNTQPPFPTAGRHSVGHFVVPLIFGALAEPLPTRIQGDVGMMNIFNVRGHHPDGSPTASLFFLAGGFGAMDGLDGAAVTPAPSNMGVVPSEMWENLMGMTVIKRELLADSGGPGKYRGGLGQQVVLRNDTGHPLTIAFMGQRTQFPALGYHGGKPGKLRVLKIDGEPVHPKGKFVLKPGTVIDVHEAGGGGFGNPHERELEAVLADVQNGFVTVAGARDDYGVTVNLKTGTATR